MKHFFQLIIISIFIFSSTSLYPKGKDFTYNVGVKGGVNFFFGPATINYKEFELGWTGLLFFETKFSKYSALELGLGYHQSNFTVTGFVDTNIKLDTFTIPILYKHYISEYFLKKSPYRLAIGLGIETRLVFNKEANNSVDLDNSQFGLTFSLENQYSITKNISILIDTRLHLGHKIVAGDNNRILNRDLIIMAGVSYSIF